METREVVWDKESRRAQKVGKQYGKIVAEKGRHKEEIIYIGFGTCGAKPT